MFSKLTILVTLITVMESLHAANVPTKKPVLAPTTKPVFAPTAKPAKPTKNPVPQPTRKPSFAPTQTMVRIINTENIPLPYNAYQTIRGPDGRCNKY